MVFSNNLLMGAAGQASGYEIDQSIRFNDDDSAFLARTPDASNRKTWTWSAWVKRADLFNGSVPQILLSAGDGGTNDFIMQFGQSDDTLRISDYISSTQSNLITTQLFGDVSAWYHFVLAYDTTQGTAANRIKLYVNGSQVTAFGTETYPSENQDLVINSAIAHNIGRGAYSSNGYFSGYMAEINFVDGTALAPTAFGKTNDDGVWVPIKYAGAYGTEGYFIDGRDSSDLGDDESGNGNDFSSSGLAAADQMPDTPTLNHWTLNPLDSGSGLANGNLQDLGGDSTHTHSPGFPITGKWYWEIVCTDINTGTAGAHFFAITDASVAYSAGFSAAAAISAGTQRGGQLKKNNSNTSTGTAIGDGDIVGMAFDADNLTLDILVNNSASGSQITGLTASRYKIWIQNGAAVTNMTFNFAEASFEYTPPTGFKSLNTSNIPTPTITDGSKYFQTTLYNGTGSELEVDQSGNSTFQPDFAWIKNRSNAGNEHDLYDAVRGATKVIFSSTTSTESTQTQGLKSFDSDGFTVGTRGEVNTSGSTNVAWQWLANNTTGSTNDDGSVDSTVAANTTAGFSICKLNPGGNSNITFGHGLGVAPRLVLVKDLEDATNWQVLHLDQGVGNKLFLNTNAAAASDANMWQNTAPTSTVVSMGTAQTTNEQFIAYCFAEIPGYSSIRSYVGNGSTDGPFVYTGFKPAFVIFKNISASSQDWEMFDNKRDGLNDANRRLYPNTNDAEPAASDRVRLTSNGFKIVTSGGTHVNGSGNTIIYMAFAEHPFGGDGVAPATAR